MGCDVARQWEDAAPQACPEGLTDAGALRGRKAPMRDAFMWIWWEALVLRSVVFFGLWLLPSLCHAGELALESRYLPYAPDAVESVAKALDTLPEVERYWRTAEEIRALRSEDAQALAGLRLVLDPGHVGGIWAAVEGRNFRIQREDHWVREGELVLEVARLVKAQLEALGAEVLLTRETLEPVNPSPPTAYMKQAMGEVARPTDLSLEAYSSYMERVINRANFLAVVSEELAVRAHWINEVARPDAVLSLHINAAVWPDPEVPSLVQSNHLHVLIFGCLSEAELASEGQREALLRKLKNGSGPEESALGRAMVERLRLATGLPPTHYDGNNAVTVEGSGKYLWARNLKLLRMVECPVLLLEPYIANSETVYPEIQRSIQARLEGEFVAEDDLIRVYANAVVEGVRAHYGN